MVGILTNIANSAVPTAFKEPETFSPERWYSKPEYIHDRRAFAPFGAGKYS